MKDFIWTKDNCVAPEKCDHIIEIFEKYQSSGWTQSRKDAETIKDTLKSDAAFGYSFAYNFLFDDNIGNGISEEVMASFMEYCDEYQALVDMNLSMKHFKIQKTDPYGGYHLWHCEQATESVSNRVAVFSLYLNDVDEGGETEFLYQRRRVSPKQGMIAWWPAAYTHTHRGNPPLGDKSKYIITGWVEFT